MSKNVPSVEEKPFVVLRLPGGEPNYKAKFEQAKAAIEKDLDNFRRSARVHLDAAMEADVDALALQVQRLSPFAREPQRVEGPVRGFVTVKYCAEIRRREEF